MRHLIIKNLILVIVAVSCCMSAIAQNAGTGSISGVVTDPSGALIANATVTVTGADGSTHVVKTTKSGNYTVPLLLPGAYTVQVTTTGFSPETISNVEVNVTETATLNVALRVGGAATVVNVNAESQQLQTESSNLGAVTDQEEVQNLPLVTRNYTQIIGLSAGVNVEVPNAAGIGLGTEGMPGQPGGFTAGGAAELDNNFQMNGVPVNDLQASGTQSGGAPIPNPDTIEQFKVVTSAYDASYGRDAGAFVNVITKGGTNDFHGNLFEFFRNTALNANDYFLKQTGQKRPVELQNQFGLTLGGPIEKDKLTFFAALQGTEQVTGGVAGTCSTSFNEPALTNTDRTAAGLGALFSGQAGSNGTGGGANVVASNGSNISPQALALLSAQLPGGQYLFPSPQVVNPSAPFATQGTYAISRGCPFDDSQFMVNSNYIQSSRSVWLERFFFDNSHNTLTLNQPISGAEGVLGFPTPTLNHYRNVSLSNNYSFSDKLLNQAVVGYNRLLGSQDQSTELNFANYGITVPTYAEILPQIAIDGAYTVGGQGENLAFSQDQYVAQDTISWVKGRHSFRFGAGVERDDLNIDSYQEYSELEFATFADFLLGLSGTPASSGGNGTGYSNIESAQANAGLYTRNFRELDGNLYAQDDFRVTRTLVVNAGVRYDRMGDPGERNGRSADFSFAAANPAAPPSGSLQGYIVAGNYPGTPPTGVTQTGGNLAINGEGQNAFSPRVGFSWQLPKLNALVLRGGYGLYHQTIAGQPFSQLESVSPWALSVDVSDPTTGTIGDPPFPAASAVTFPNWTPAPYSPTTTLSPFVLNPTIRPPSLHHYSLDLETQLHHGFLLDVGYMGTRQLHLLTTMYPNQAVLASATNPINGVTTNTVANVQQRVPVLGFGAGTAKQITNEASGWYNAGYATLSKQTHHGLSMQASYTWTRDLTTVISPVDSTVGGRLLGNQLIPSHDYGPDRYIRPQRFVLSGVYELPKFADWNYFSRNVLGGWRVSGVATLQDGHFLSALGRNKNSAYGITSNGKGDFAELSSTCTLSQVNTPGPTRQKLSDWVNTSCFTTSYPVIGSDGKATAFGNTRPGIIKGPDQDNVDMALAKLFPIKWRESQVEFRAEAFNVLNHENFSDPGNNDASSSFGIISSSAVNPRILQFALKINY
jgi:Carboxypeptidase regulatory-like domain/TonB-dependent Receptor Plug Domain